MSVERGTVPISQVVGENKNDIWFFSLKKKIGKQEEKAGRKYIKFHPSNSSITALPEILLLWFCGVPENINFPKKSGAMDLD